MSEKEMISLKHTQDIAILEGKVSELENWRKGFRKLGKIFDKRWEDNKKKIAELKGEVEINSMDGQSSINHIINIEKVLRELIENLRINDRLDCYLPKQLLAKLDSGGEKEYKKCTCGMDLRFFICPKCNSIKDLGDEKFMEIDSKPPEPKSCKGCKFVPKDKSLSNCEKWDCNEFDKYEPRTNSNEIRL